MAANTAAPASRCSGDSMLAAVSTAETAHDGACLRATIEMPGRPEQRVGHHRGDAGP